LSGIGSSSFGVLKVVATSIMLATSTITVVMVVFMDHSLSVPT
jgi:hypothetical protein